MVLTGRCKLAMERMYRTAVPDTKGSSIIFRQGSPLLSEDLTDVNCTEAASIIVVSDHSRAPNEADGQTARTAVLIDELMQQYLHQSGRRRPSEVPTVVVEILKASNSHLLQYVASVGAQAPPKSCLITHASVPGTPRWLFTHNDTTVCRRASSAHARVECKAHHALGADAHYCSR